MPSVCVILNPVAGRGQGARRRSDLRAALDQVFGADGWTLRETTAPGSAVQLAREAASQGFETVAAAGGDGTYGEVANGLIGTSARLGVLPLGTGNDFSRTLGLGTDLNLAVRTLREGEPKRIDLGLIQGRYFLNAAGCGFDALVAERVNRGYRSLHGTTAYIAAVLERLARLSAADVVVEVDGTVYRQKAVLCAVANAPSYGGGMRVAPDARIDDGRLDICLIGEAGRLEFLRAFPRVYRGTHVTHPKVRMLTGREIRVESQPPLPVLVDGEVIGTTPAHFEVAPGALVVMAPVA